MTLQNPLTLKVLTLNCWGIPLLSKDRTDRMLAIGETLAAMDLDIIGLQEIYLETDREKIINELKKKGVNYNQYFPSGMLGSGLMILSRFPILEKQFWKYKAQGRPNDIIRPDYYSGKGLAWCRIQSPVGEIDFYNTHLIAPYDEIGENVYFSHRVAQSYEITKQINLISKNSAVIFAGDLNCPPDELTYRYLCQNGSLIDSYESSNNDSPGYTITEEIPYILLHEPERADYILYRSTQNLSMKTVKSEVVLNTLPEKYQSKMRSFSDHFGVMTYFEITDIPTEENINQPLYITGEETRSTIINGITQSKKFRTSSLLLTIISLLLSANLVIFFNKIKISRRKFLKLCPIFVLLLFSSALNGLTVYNSESERKFFQEILSNLEPE